MISDDLADKMARLASSDFLNHLIERILFLTKYPSLYGTETWLM